MRNCPSRTARCIVGALLPLIAGCPQLSGGDSAQLLPGFGGGASNSALANQLIGIYVGQMSGADQGTTLIEVRLTNTRGRLLVTTLQGDGFFVDIDDNADISITQTASGEGTVLGMGDVIGTSSLRFTVDVSGTLPFADGQTDWVVNRILGTDTSFPLDVQPSGLLPFLNQSYTGSVSVVEPASNALLSALSGQGIGIQTLASSLLVQFDAGGTFGGVMRDPQRWVTRLVEGAEGDFATLPGSTSNPPLDVVGRLDFTNLQTFTAVIITQTRGPLGSQQQRVYLLGTD